MATKPGLEFFFSACDEDERSARSLQAFERAFRMKLSEFVSDQTAKLLQKCTITQYQQGVDLSVEINGDGRIIEEVRARMDSNLSVMSYEGRLMDNHPTVLVKRDLLMPYIGVRGKGGGLNFAIDVLQFRDTFIGTGPDQGPIPESMPFGNVDACRRPRPDFWRMVLPKFAQNARVGFAREINEDTATAQALGASPT